MFLERRCARVDRTSFREREGAAFLAAVGILLRLCAHLCERIRASQVPLVAAEHLMQRA